MTSPYMPSILPQFGTIPSGNGSNSYNMNYSPQGSQQGGGGYAGTSLPQYGVIAGNGGMFGSGTGGGGGGNFQNTYGAGGGPIQPKTQVVPWWKDQQTLGNISTGVEAATGIAEIWQGFKQAKLQKKQFNFTKEAWNKNYANQVKDYENALKDKWAARDASARLNHREFQSLNTYLGDRSLTGK